MGALSYFDLGSNQRMAGGLETTETGATAAPAGAGPAPAGPTAQQQALQYAALVLGIVLEPWLTAYAASGSAGLDLGGMLGRLPFGLIMGLVLFPAVYRNAFDPTKPMFVQFCAVVVTGIGWQSAFNGVIGATTGGS